MARQERRPGPESTLAETRERLIQSASRQLLERGFDIGLEDIKLSSAIAAAGVTRATAYRSLADEELGPQEKLRHEVLTRLLQRDSRVANRDAVELAINELLEERGAEIASPDIAVRTGLMRSVIRIGCLASHRTISTSTERALLIAAYGAISSQGAHREQWQLDELQRGEDAMTTVFNETYTGLASLFRLKLRPPFEMADVSTAIAAFAEGMGMRDVVSDRLDHIMLPTGINGEIEEWSLQGICVISMMPTFFEPIDPAQPFVDLSSPVGLP